LLKACEELGIAVVAYSPLGRGMLTGTYVSRLPINIGIFTLAETRSQKSNDDIPEGDWRKVIPK
jgi:aryl-alcohol dehydrogenase-like predicted oxidoreductase